MAFSFVPMAVFNPALFMILNLDAAGLTTGLPAANCGVRAESGTFCVILADVLAPPDVSQAATTVPQPRTVLGSQRRG